MRKQTELRDQITQIKEAFYFHKLRDHINLLFYGSQWVIVVTSKSVQ